MNHIFVSYSRSDSETVDKIVARLNEDGLDVWIDREEIKGGELWREEIVKAVDNSYAFVLMLSPHSVASENVRKEVDLAEGSKRELVPVLLAPVKLPDKLRYELAGIQWIEYYRDPEAKYAELVQDLQGYRQKLGIVQMPPTREVELVFSGLDLSKLSDEEKKRLVENLLNSISTTTNTPRADLDLVKMTDGSIHAFVNMPADSAYRIKTAALNRDSRLINFGIDALRLSGDSKFVLLKTGRIGPLKNGRPGCRSWLIGSLIIAMFISLVTIYAVKATDLAPLILTAINTYMPVYSTAEAPVYPPTLTGTLTPTNTFTSTPSPTFTLTKTATPSPTASLTAIFTTTMTYTPTASHTPTRTSTPTNTRTPTRTPTFPITRTWTPTITPSVYVPPADTEPPTIYSIDTNASKLYYVSSISKGSCDPLVLTIWASIKDSSGVADVWIEYNYILKGVSMGGDKLPMNIVSGNSYDGAYVVQINVGDEAKKYLDPYDGQIGYQIYATDTLGNTPKDVPVNYIDVLACQ